jgi:hypothetical protein
MIRLIKLLDLTFRAARRIRNLFRKLFIKVWGSKISEAAFLKSLQIEFHKREDFIVSVKEQKSRSFFLHPDVKDQFILTLQRVSPQARYLIVQSADSICEHQFSLLGSGPVNLGGLINWHSDFKSGFRWDSQKFYEDIHPAPYPGGYDLKVPWELSRCQHFAWLGQAYWLTNDDKYTREFRAEIEDWIKQNPPEFGVNWACSMDIAIRAVNWLWGYAFFQASPVIDDAFRLEFYRSLLCHGRHIMANLERTATFAGNHYLSNIVGLIYLGIMLPEFKEAQIWRKFGLKELESEMFKQVYSDGGNFEASTNYHRLVAELFLSATLLARLNGHQFSLKFMERLEKMLEVIFQITKPDGTVPVIGDQDNGRLHRLKVWENADLEWKDFRPILAIGSILFDRMDWGKLAIGHWEEAIWFYGDEAAAVHAKALQNPDLRLTSVGFADTGLYILRADDIYTIVDLGLVGQNGNGGHAHNDVLSFELCASGQTWIQDPGTYVYTADYEARNWFRATESHNTLSQAGYEQNTFNLLSLFRMKSESAVKILSWHVNNNSYAYLKGELRRQKSPKILHCRSFFLDRENRALLIRDHVSKTRKKCRLMFHFSPNIKIESVAEPYRGIKMINPVGQTAWLFSVSTGRANIQLTNGWISESYGSRFSGRVASLDLKPEFLHKTIILLPASAPLIQRIRSVLKNEDHHN